MITEVVYDGRDNTIDLLLLADEVPYDLSSVTKVEIVDVRGQFTAVNSDDYPNSFDWSGALGVVELTLGSLTWTKDSYKVRLVVYGPGFTNGLVWDEFQLKIE